jgi:hypothetical protein
MRPGNGARRRPRVALACSTVAAALALVASAAATSAAAAAPARSAASAPAPPASAVPARDASAAAVPAAAATSPAEPQAQGRRLTISAFDVTYQVNLDGSLQVEERITAHFEGSWNGLYRWIPVKYELEGGGRHTIRLDVVSVEDDGGRPLRHEVSREGALLRIKTWVPGAQDAYRTVVYRYKVENGLRHFEDDAGMAWAHDELYWNVTGNEWEVPILRVQARVILPEQATGLRAVGYTGRYGSQGGDYQRTVLGRTADFETTRQLDPGEGLTIVVGWDAGLIREPSLAKRIAWFFRDFPFLPIPIFAFAAMFTLWRKRGRDPELSRSIMPQYEPPEGLSPAEVGTLMDFSVDPRDLSATIIDLAVRGYLRIEEVPSKWRQRAKDHIIHVLTDPEAATDLKEFEAETLRSLRKLATSAAAGGPDAPLASVRVSELRNEFYRHVSGIKRRIFDRLTRSPKLFTGRPENVLGVWIGLGVLVGGLCVALAALATRFELGEPTGRWAALIAVPIIIIGFGIFMPARTLKGAWALNHVLGLREYIDRVDRDRLKYATLEHFEKLLPFAAALGLEKKWAKAFESILSEPPRWYVSHYPGPFQAQYFSNSLGRMAAATGAALVTAPRSASGGSGFGGGGGGGFSGGGFGGGGGGGF